MVYKEGMGRRALVLGGGGVTGVAWETGLIAGLADLGIDLAAADVIVGTSAGSVTGADLTSGQELTALYQAQLAPPVIEARLRVGDWPAKVLKVTAVDARTGEFVVFDSAGDAGLVDAVGASCAVPGVWPPVTIGDRRFVDGGLRSIANADLAAGYERVVIVAPVANGIGHMTSPRQHEPAVHPIAGDLQAGVGAPSACTDAEGIAGVFCRVASAAANW